MKSIIKYIIIIALGMSSCRDYRHRIIGEGPEVKELRSSSSFTGISLSMDADVEVFYDSQCRIELYAQRNILDVIDIRVNGNTLCIGLEKYVSIRRHSGIKIKVYTNRLDLVDISGSGEVSCRYGLSSNNLSCNISGSGDIRYYGMLSGSCKANISGSGNIFLESGSCNNVVYSISGSGRLYADKLRATEASCSISGSGDMYVYVSNQLNASISGSGDIFYKGSPAIDAHISGSGKIKSIQ